MGIKLKLKDKVLLDCSNAIYWGLYNHLVEFIETNNITLSEDLTKFIENLESGCRGIGLNITNYLKSKNDVLRFTSIITKSLDSLYQETPDLDESYKELYEKFYNNLVEAQQAL